MKQKKLLRLIFILFVAISLLFCASCRSPEPGDPTTQPTQSLSDNTSTKETLANQKSDDTSTKETLSVEEMMAAQKRAMDACQVLNEYFYCTGWSNHNLPDYFGGMYIEDNILHVRLANPSQQTRDFLTALFTNYRDVVVFEDAEYSRAMLLEYMDVLYTALNENGCKLTEGCVDSKTGVIEISVLEEDLDRTKQLVEHLQKILWGQNAPPVDVVKGFYAQNHILYLE